jgi:16S rRNA C967 or C1407 C5-methylase (RsmB/RsmF family)/NOL1/NOP2/fmu family ribosome biogenesis protein
LPIPKHISSHFRDAPGFDETAFCRIHETGEQVTSVRLNPAKFSDAGALSFSLKEKIPWTSLGYYLEERPFFTFDPLLHAGAFYVQEPSSMSLEQAVLQTFPDTNVPLNVLDLCSAPGGKSTHLQSLLPAGSVLVSNEVIRARVGILEENLIKWGASNTIITNNDPRDFSSILEFFDLIVVDAPCSGSGMFRRDPASMDHWSADLVNLSSQRQQRILADIWPSLKEGGILIYSTCSYSVQEDETIADWIMQTFDADSVPLKTDKGWNIVETESSLQKASGYRFYPDKLKGEGFYLAVFRKISGGPQHRRKEGRKKWETVPQKIRESVQQWMNTKELSLISSNDNLLAMPAAVESSLSQLQSLYVRQAGTTIGKWSGKDLIPDHAFALSKLTSETVPVVDVSREAALNYLRKEEFKTEQERKGWAIVQFMGHSLGWVKVLPNRANNYYPKEWRILKPA